MDTLEKTIKERKENLQGATNSPVDHHKDFLHHLFQARNYKRCSSDQMPTLTDAQIKDNILTMIIAGKLLINLLVSLPTRFLAGEGLFTGSNLCILLKTHFYLIKFHSNIFLSLK